MAITADELASIRADYLKVAPGLAAPLESADTVIQEVADAWLSGMADEMEPQYDRGKYGQQWVRAMTLAIAHVAATEQDGADERGDTAYKRRLAGLSSSLGKARRGASPSFGGVL